MNIYFSIRNVLAVIALLVVSAGLAMMATDSASAKADARAIAVTGISTVDGEQVLVHIIASVQAGKSDQEVAAAALNSVNARGLRSDEYSLLDNSWDVFSDGDPGNDFVVQRYNSKNETVGGQAAIEAARVTWNDANSPFAFGSGMESTGKCPSLVDECRGRQAFDGENDIGWVKLRDPNTLAVTWSGTTTDEADVAFNTNYSWSTDTPASATDIETVALHELGHVAGIGHSAVNGSIMEPLYAGIRRTLTTDDIEALQAWYGSSAAATATPTPDPDATATPTPVPTATPVPGTELYVGGIGTVNGDGVVYSLSGKKGRDLIITVSITSDGSTPVDGASISITSTNAGAGWNGSGTATTNSSGEARLRIRNAPDGDWVTTVNSATAGSLGCDTDCPDGPHTYTK